MKVIADRIQGKAPKGARRSKDWPAIRRQHLAEHPACAVCESTRKVEVHHLVPFHLAPDLELEPTNLLTLCENKRYGINCHLLIGHVGNYRRVNVVAELDAIVWNSKIKGRG